MQTLIISKPNFNIAKGIATVSAEIELPDRNFELYFRGSSDHIGECGADPFLAVCLTSAMKLKLPIEVRGDVSPRLLRTLNTIQEIFQCWYPENLSRVAITACPRLTEKEAALGCASFFSGGVDSFYTAYKQINQVSALVFVHGFDISLGNRSLRAIVSKKIKETSSALNKSLVEVETNSRQLTDNYVSWAEHQFGPALASVAFILNPIVSKVFIPSSESYAHLDPCGSHPLLDPLWSTEYIKIIHDGSECTRNQKVSEITRHHQTLHFLRTCWENPDNKYNCGSCEKCIRTMINLETAGSLQQCTAFDVPLIPERVASMRIPLDLVYFHVLENLRILKTQGKNLALITALETAVNRYRTEKIAKELQSTPRFPSSPEIGLAVSKHIKSFMQSLNKIPGVSFPQKCLAYIFQFLSIIWRRL